jgi:hypothetical protein
MYVSIFFAIRRYPPFPLLRRVRWATNGPRTGL